MKKRLTRTGMFLVLFLTFMIGILGGFLLNNYEYHYNRKGFELLSEYQKDRYVKDVFDCSDMTKECEIIFHKMGLETKRMYGNNTDKSHVWLAVNISGNWLEFETTLFMFKKVSDKY